MLLQLNSIVFYFISSNIYAQEIYLFEMRKREIVFKVAAQHDFHLVVAIKFIMKKSILTASYATDLK
jgi:hypothetical protein